MLATRRWISSACVGLALCGVVMPFATAIDEKVGNVDQKVFFLRGSLDDFLTHVNAADATEIFARYVEEREAEIKELSKSERTAQEREKIEQGNRYLHGNYPRWYNSLNPYLHKSVRELSTREKEVRCQARTFLYRLALYQDFLAEKEYERAGFFHSIGHQVKNAWHASVEWVNGWLPLGKTDDENIQA